MSDPKEPKTTKTRAKRVNHNYKADFDKIGELVKDLQRHCEISIEVIESLNTTPDSEYMRGQAAALKAVLARLEKGK